MKFTMALLLAPLAAALPHANSPQILPMRRSTPSHNTLAARHDTNSSGLPPPYLTVPGHRPGPKFDHGNHHTNYSGAAALHAQQTGVKVTDFLVRQTLDGNTMNVLGNELVSFKLNGNVTCEVDFPDPAPFTFPCGMTGPYSFGMMPSNSSSSFGLRIFKGTTEG